MAAIQAQVGMKQYPVQPQVNMEPLSGSHELQGEAKADSLRWFTYLLKTRPMAFWSGVWVSVFLVAVVAVGSLISPNAAERRSVSAIAIGSDSVVATQPLDKKGQVPFWLFGAIAITCTAGSLLVSRQLNSKNPLTHKAPSRRRTVQKPLTASHRKVAKRPQQQVAQHLATKPHRQRKKPIKQPQRLKPYSPSEALFNRPQSAPLPQSISPTSAANYSNVQPQRPVIPSFTVKQSAAKQSSPQSQPKRAQAPKAEMPPVVKTSKPINNVSVTVVPNDHVHPLDWQAPRLADAVDLRRRKSVKAWM